MSGDTNGQRRNVGWEKKGGGLTREGKEVTHI